MTSYGYPHVSSTTSRFLRDLYGGEIGRATPVRSIDAIFKEAKEKLAERSGDVHQPKIHKHRYKLRYTDRYYYRFGCLDCSDYFWIGKPILRRLITRPGSKIDWSVRPVGT